MQYPRLEWPEGNKSEATRIKLNHFSDNLSSLKMQLSSDQDIVNVRGNLQLTKTNFGITEAYMFRDKLVEQQTYQRIMNAGGYLKYINRYFSYDSTVHDKSAPLHYAVRLLAGNGSITSGKNIFAFFPDAFNAPAYSDREVFGLEFIDVWENIFKLNIIPCVREVFDLNSQIKIFTSLEMNLASTIYLAAIFHEIGHRYGPWKVSPARDPELNMSKFHWDVMGELSTDCLLVSMLREFPEMVLFIILQRIFWFSKRAYSENPVSGLANTDGDSWIGLYLWNKLHKARVVSRMDSKLWSLNTENVISLFESITNEIDELAVKLKNSTNQDQVVQEWMKSQVKWSHDSGYEIPYELSSIFESCHKIPDYPHYSTPFGLSEFRSWGQL